MYSECVDNVVLPQLESCVVELLDRTRCGSMNMIERLPSNNMDTASKEIPISKRGRRPNLSIVKNVMIEERNFVTPIQIVASVAEEFEANPNVLKRVGA